VRIAAPVVLFASLLSAVACGARTALDTTQEGNDNGGGAASGVNPGSSNGAGGSSSAAATPSSGGGSGSSSEGSTGPNSSDAIPEGAGDSGSDGTTGSTGSCDITKGGSDSDATLPSFDAAPPGLAGFAFVVNDVVQHPLSCAGVNWEFPPYPGTTTSVTPGCMPPDGGLCPCIWIVIVVNTGALYMAYIAGPWWSGQNYVPGGYPGGDYLAGVLAPGAYVDITAFYNSGDVAILGSAEPFSSPDASYAADEGVIPWPLGVQGSAGAANMYVAEIEVRDSCSPVQQNW